MPYPYSREGTHVLGRDHYSGTAITAWLDKLGPDYAKWLGVPYTPVPRDYGTNIRKAINHFKALDPSAELPAMLVAALIVHESAAGQSHFFKTRNNPSGIGAVNDNPNQALVFASHYDGILATVSRLLVYAKGSGPWEATAPRAEIIKANGWYGVVIVLADLEQKWAFTPWDVYNALENHRRYGASVASLMNDGHQWIEHNQVNDRPKVPMPVIQNCLIPVGRGNRPGYFMDPEWITIHDTGNRSVGAGEDNHCTYVTTNPATKNEPSWHFTVGDSKILQHLPTNENGWHAADGANGPGNRKSIAIEMTVDQGQNFEQAMFNLADLVAWLADEHLIPLHQIVQHNHWKSPTFPNGKHCPAWIRETGTWGTLLGMVQERMERGGDTVVDDPNARYFPETDKWVINQREVRMLEYWESLGGIASEGYPLAGMTQDQDLVFRQIFENSMLEFWPNENIYRRGGLGQRYMRLRDDLAICEAGIGEV